MRCVAEENDTAVGTAPAGQWRDFCEGPLRAGFGEGEHSCHGIMPASRKFGLHFADGGWLIVMREWGCGVWVGNYEDEVVILRVGDRVAYDVPGVAGPGDLVLVVEDGGGGGMGEHSGAGDEGAVDEVDCFCEGEVERRDGAAGVRVDSVGGYDKVCAEGLCFGVDGEVVRVDVRDLGVEGDDDAQRLCCPSESLLVVDPVDKPVGSAIDA